MIQSFGTTIISEILKGQSYWSEGTISKWIGFSETPKVGVKTTFSRSIDEITIHNTETPADQSIQDTVDSISRSHEARFGYDTKSCKWVEVAYHYLIGNDWTVVQTRCLNEIGYHNSKNNLHSIGIALVWNLNDAKPSPEQYEALNVLLSVLTQVFTWAEVKPHRSRWSTCPGKYFDKLEIKDYLYISDKPVKKNNLLWTYTISRYYSPEPWQDHYFGWKTYAQDVTTQCGAWAIGNNGCSYPADWHRLNDSDILRSIACPAQFPLGTRFNIKGWWWVTCVDRGWSIINRKLDLRAWYGIDWLKTIEGTKRPAGDVTVTEIDFSNVKK
jgi:hypothetical protein